MESNELLGRFLDLIWGMGDRPRRVGLSYKPTPQTYEIPPLQTWPKGRDTVIKFIQGISAKGQTPYFAPAMLKPDAISLEKSDVIASWVLWCDFDGNAEEALRRLDTLPGLPRPSLRLSSGLPGHEHWYWLLEAPAAAQSFEAVNKKLAYYLNGDIGCWNMNRVMRPPMTVNYFDAPKYTKTGKTYEPMPVDFIEFSETRYKLAEFDCLPSSEGSIEYNVSQLGDIPSIGMVLAKHTWDDKHLDLFINPPMGKGGRSDALARMAHFGAEQAMSDEEIYALLRDLDDRMGKFRDRADRDRRLAEFIVNARNKHPFADEIKIKYTDEPMQLVWTYNELRRSKFKVNWLIDKFIVARTINMITALPGTGKSRFTLQMAMSMATGTQFLRWPITKPMSVLYLSLEMQIDMLKHFSDQLSDEDLPEEHDGNFKLIPLGQAVDITKPEGIAFIRKIVEENKPEVLFIDALGKLVLEEIGEVQSKAISNQLNSLAAEFGTTFFLVHHNRKDEKSSGNNKGNKRPSLSDVYGNQYITTDAALVLMLWKPENENQSHIELIFAKSRAYPADEFLVLNGRKGFKFVMKVKEDDNDGPSEPNFGGWLGNN